MTPEMMDSVDLAIVLIDCRVVVVVVVVVVRKLPTHPMPKPLNQFFF